MVSVRSRFGGSAQKRPAWTDIPLLIKAACQTIEKQILGFPALARTLDDTATALALFESSHSHCRLAWPAPSRSAHANPQSLWPPPW